jgi:hypothetical protein
MRDAGWTGWIAAGWVATALTAAVVLGISGAMPGRWPERAHLVGHLGLCSVLAVLLAQTASRVGPARAAGLALAGTVLFGAAIEAVQLRHHPHWAEVVYDLLCDGIGATAGVVAWAEIDRTRREPVGHLLSAALHPLWVAPTGLAMALYAAERSGGTAVYWTAAATACVAPAIAFWGLGLARRWWSDADLSRRTDRRGLYLVGCGCALSFVVLALRGPVFPALGPLGSQAALVMAALCASGALAGTAITGAGLKVSGHVAIPAALGLAMLSWSPRGAWLLLAVAVALSWARIVAGRHFRSEVVAAWMLAGVLAAVMADDEILGLLGALRER